MTTNTPTSPREELARALYPEVFQAADSDIAFWRDPSESGYSETSWALFRRCRRTLEAVHVAYERLDAAVPALSRPPVKAASPEGEPVAWVSPDQLEAHLDPKGEHFGGYLPVRKKKGGLFTMALYAMPQALPMPPYKFQTPEHGGGCLSATPPAPLAAQQIAKSANCPEAPVGWKLVPIEAVQEQVDAIFDTHAAQVFESPFGPDGSFAAYYRAAVAAAPIPENRGDLS